MFVLDTNVLSAARFDPSVLQSDDVVTTCFNLSEILYGAARRPDLAAVQAFAAFVVSDFGWKE